MKNKEFPKDFLWGASTSAFQVEGGFNEERGTANSDMRHIPDGLADYKTASDHYHHVKEDVQLMKELGMKGRKLTEKLVNYALHRKEKLVVISVQDLLCMNKTHRMNEPGLVNEQNWTFKLIDFKKLEKTLKRFF